MGAVLEALYFQPPLRPSPAPLTASLKTAAAITNPASSSRPAWHLRQSQLDPFPLASSGPPRRRPESAPTPQRETYCLARHPPCLGPARTAYPEADTRQAATRMEREGATAARLPFGSTWRRRCGVFAFRGRPQTVCCHPRVAERGLDQASFVIVRCLSFGGLPGGRDRPASSVRD